MRPKRQAKEAAANDDRDMVGRTLALVLVVILLAMARAAAAQTSDPAITRFLGKVEPAETVPGADSFGPLRDDLPIVPALQGEETIGWVFLNSDFAGSVGYSGKPIHVMVGIDLDGVITGAKLVKHYEPIVLVGIPEQDVANVITGYAGLDVTKETGPEAVGHDIDIISGATVTIMVIDDSITRSAIKVARALGLGGLTAEIASTGPKRVIDETIDHTKDWLTLLGDGSVRRLSLDIGMVNRAFDDQAGGKAPGRPEPGAADAPFIDLHAALVTIPTIGRSLLGDAEYANLQRRLKEGEHAILVAGRGRYSFKGSGYVRGGIFDRIVLIQGDRSVRFRDRQHKRLGRIAAEGAPSFKEVDLFMVPADAGFDPAEPWRLQLLVQRATGPTDKIFLTYDLPYAPPDQYLKTEASETAVAATQPLQVAAVGEGEFSLTGDALWQRIWRDRTVDIAILAIALTLLT
ncbi:MAG: FMN-binding protein, partial [Geminicoccaceae bacterium]